MDDDEKHLVVSCRRKMRRALGMLGTENFVQLQIFRIIQRGLLLHGRMTCIELFAARKLDRTYGSNIQCKRGRFHDANARKSSGIFNRYRFLSPSSIRSPHAVQYSPRLPANADFMGSARRRVRVADPSA